VAVSLFEKYLSKLTPLITAADEAESKAYYRQLPVEALWEWLQELEMRRMSTGQLHQFSSHSEAYRIRLIDLQIGWMKSVLQEKAVYPVLLPQSQKGPAEPREKHYITDFGRNIDRLRFECGWSFDELA
jgi:hypothetical protein